MLKKYWPDPLVVLIPLLSGLILSILFALDIIIPVDVGAPLMYVATIWGLVFIKTSTTSLLPRLMIVLYSLPFSTTIHYLWNEKHLWWNWPAKVKFEWKEKVDPVPLMFDPVLVNHMVMIGLIGLLGLLTGIALIARTGKKQATCVPSPHTLAQTIKEEACVLLTTPNRRYFPPAGILRWLPWNGMQTLARFQPRRRPILTTSHSGMLGWLVFLGALGLIIFFSWIFAPANTIFTEAYRKSVAGSIAAAINFRSAFQVASVLLIVLFLDAERATIARTTQYWKYLSIILVTLFIAVFFQFLRGERDVMGVIAGLFALYVTAPVLSAQRPERLPTEWRRILILLVPVTALVAAAILVGSVRESLSKGEFSLPVQIQRYWSRSTWNGVLLTPLFLTESYVYGPMEYEYGQTYVEYALSLPPGIITRAIGIERPIDRQFEEAWGFSRKSAGGIHIAVLPFKNFGIAGLFVILALYGWLIGYLEQANTAATFWSRLLYGTVVATSIFWFWYGDITMIRGFMIAALAGFIYQGWLRYAPPFRPLVSLPEADACDAFTPGSDNDFSPR
jgi:hypothetical protein